MNAYYSGLAKDVTWEGLLSSIRGQVIHSGAIHLNTRGELLGWFHLACHLHDICKRIVLWQVGYRGTYNPSNVMFRGAYELDRITRTTTVEEMGYAKPPNST